MDSGGDEEEENDFTVEQIQQMLESDDDVLQGEVGEEELTWSSDFNEFHGVREEFHEEVGPRIEGTSPLGLITLWEQPLLESIANKTNNYAWQKICSFFDTEENMPIKSLMNSWIETSVLEIYRLIAIFILMAVCVRDRIDEYWTTGTMGMPGFWVLMS